MATSPSTRKTRLDVAEPAGAVTVIGPVVAPAGTIATSRFGAAAVIVVGRPLKTSEFCAIVAPKPLPNTWTVAPAWVYR